MREVTTWSICGLDFPAMNPLFHSFSSYSYSAFVYFLTGSLHRIFSFRLTVFTFYWLFLSYCRFAKIPLSFYLWITHCSSNFEYLATDSDSLFVDSYKRCLFICQARPTDSNPPSYKINLTFLSTPQQSASSSRATRVSTDYFDNSRKLSYFSKV